MAALLDSTVYGFDAVFIDEVREDFKCVVCHLVLRDPLQILSCGHRFCSPCYNRMKIRAEQSNVQLLCPVDREIVPLQEVFPDRGISRTIGNLKVKCCNCERGCDWVDDLRDLSHHEEQCEYKLVEDINRLSLQENGNELILQQILSRVESCEEGLAAKDKEIALLKATVVDMKDDLKFKEAQIDELKLANSDLQKRFDSLDGGVKSETTSMSTRMDVLKDQTEPDGNYEGSPGQNNRLISCVNDIAVAKKRIESLQSAVDGMACTLRNQNDKLQSEEHFAEMLLKNENVMNIENVLFMKNSASVQDITFEWVIRNYKHLHDLGEPVDSPVFSTTVDGYRCQLSIDWTGKKKGKLIVYLLLAKSELVDGHPAPFNREYTLTLQKNRGGTESHRISFQSIRKNADAFALPLDGTDEVTNGFGFGSDLPHHHFIINDSVFVSCTIHF